MIVTAQTAKDLNKIRDFLDDRICEVELMQHCETPEGHLPDLPTMQGELTNLVRMYEDRFGPYTAADEQLPSRLEAQAKAYRALQVEHGAA